MVGLGHFGNLALVTTAAISSLGLRQGGGSCSGNRFREYGGIDAVAAAMPTTAGGDICDSTGTWSGRLGLRSWHHEAGNKNRNNGEC